MEKIGRFLLALAFALEQLEERLVGRAILVDGKDPCFSSLFKQLGHGLALVQLDVEAAAAIDRPGAGEAFGRGFRLRSRRRGLSGGRRAVGPVRLGSFLDRLLAEDAQVRRSPWRIRGVRWSVSK